MLTNIIPASWRKGVYATYALAATAEGAMLTAYSTIHALTPSWLLIAMSVTVYVGIAVGAVAASNVPAPAPKYAILDAIADPMPLSTMPSATTSYYTGNGKPPTSTLS
jgi:hypothetical protein